MSILKITRTTWGDYTITRDVEIDGVPRLEEIAEISSQEVYELREQINRLIDDEGHPIK